MAAPALANPGQTATPANRLQAPYQAHFGLTREPFGLSPNTHFFFAGSSHQAALNTLLVALNSGEGFVAVVGEVGLGKTLICRQLLNTLGPQFTTAYIPNPVVDARTLRKALARELQLPVPASFDDADLHEQLHDRLLEIARSGRRVVLIIDEAQALPDDTLECVRLLTNLETESFKLLQVVLFAQPELDRRLKQPHLRQLRQRIAFSHRLVPLDRALSTAYLRHRAQLAGHAQSALFSGRAEKLLHTASRGVPRVLNILAHKSLLAAWGRGATQVTAGHVMRAVRDTSGLPLPWWLRWSGAA